MIRITLTEKFITLDHEPGEPIDEATALSTWHDQDFCCALAAARELAEERELGLAFTAAFLAEWPGVVLS